MPQHDTGHMAADLCVQTVQSSILTFHLHRIPGEHELVGLNAAGLEDCCQVSQAGPEVALLHELLPRHGHRPLLCMKAGVHLQRRDCLGMSAVRDNGHAPAGYCLCLSSQLPHAGTMVHTCRTPSGPGLHCSVQCQTVFKDLPCSWKVVSTCKAGVSVRPRTPASQMNLYHVGQ